MSILTDQEFQDAVQRTPKVIPRSLWSHLNKIAQYLALIGDYEAAYDVWKFAYQDIPYIPEWAGYYGDASVTALCRCLKRGDLSHGHPRSDVVKAGTGMEDRFSLYDRAARRSLTTDPWQFRPSNEEYQRMRQAIIDLHGDNVDIPLVPVVHQENELIQKFLALARPQKGQRYSTTELETLQYLDQYHAYVLSQGKPSAGWLVLGADIALRHQQRERSDAYLRRWYDTVTSSENIIVSGDMIDMVFALYTTASLVIRGVLSDKSDMTKQERRELVDTLLAPPSNASSYLLNPPKAPTEITIWPDYSTLSFEPSWDVDQEETWHLSEHEEMIVIQQDEPYPISVQLMTPWNTGDCVITVEYPDAVPDWNEAMHAYSFPIRVEPNPRAGFPDGVVGTLFPSTLPCGIGDEGFEVPPGEYDALARFFFTKDSDIGFDYRVIVSLMPRGTMAHGILKLDEARLAEIRNQA